MNSYNLMSAIESSTYYGHSPFNHTRLAPTPPHLSHTNFSITLNPNIYVTFPSIYFYVFPNHNTHILYLMLTESCSRYFWCAQSKSCSCILDCKANKRSKPRYTWNYDTQFLILEHYAEMISSLGSVVYEKNYSVPFIPFFHVQEPIVVDAIW